MIGKIRLILNITMFAVFVALLAFLAFNRLGFAQKITAFLFWLLLTNVLFYIVELRIKDG